ncbi:MAG: ATP-binding cassette domain-containing protein [Puniceicoccales bacterium]|jgi:putative ABC transport system ATP-binding protein|nr:ATP-binding cassette domain-containing protein [Puniceicoccales bacterium]
MGNSVLHRRSAKEAAAIAPAPLIRLRELTKTYGTGTVAFQALRGINLSIRKGEFVAIMGHSGSGKSTLMNILGCLDTPSTGSFRYKDIRVEKLSPDQRSLLRRHSLGFVFQGFNLLARTSTLENVELPLLYRGLGKKERHAKALKALAAVGLSDKINNTPAELSGGQQQRVAIARAIVTEPDTLLADEPTGNLDSTTSHEIMKLIRRLNRKMGITILMVTHEDEVAAYARRIIRITDGQIASDHFHCKKNLPHIPLSSTPLRRSRPCPAPIPIPEPLPDIYDDDLVEYSGGILQPFPLPSATASTPRTRQPKPALLPPEPPPPVSLEEMISTEKKLRATQKASLADFLPSENIPSILDVLPPQISDDLLLYLGALSQPPPLPRVVEDPNALPDSDFDTETGLFPEPQLEPLPEIPELPELGPLDENNISNYDTNLSFDDLDIPSLDETEPAIPASGFFIEEDVTDFSENTNPSSGSEADALVEAELKASLEAFDEERSELEEFAEEDIEEGGPADEPKSEPEPVRPSFLTTPQAETPQPKAFVVPRSLSFSISSPAVYPLPGKCIVNLLLPRESKATPVAPPPPPPPKQSSLPDKPNAVKILTPDSVERLLARISATTVSGTATPTAQPAPKEEPLTPAPTPQPTPSLGKPTPEPVATPEPTSTPIPAPTDAPANGAPQVIVVEGPTINITHQVPVVINNNLPVPANTEAPAETPAPAPALAKEAEVLEVHAAPSAPDEVPQTLPTPKKNGKVVLKIIPPVKETEILVAIPPKIKKRRRSKNAGSANYKSSRENSRKWTKARTKRYNFHKDGIH